MNAAAERNQRGEQMQYESRRRAKPTNQALDEQENRQPLPGVSKSISEERSDLIRTFTKITGIILPQAYNNCKAGRVDLLHFLNFNPAAVQAQEP